MIDTIKSSEDASAEMSPSGHAGPGEYQKGA